MLKLSEIKELIKLLDSTSIQQIEIEEDNWKINIRKADVVQAPAAPAAPVYAAPPVHIPAAVQTMSQSAVAPADGVSPAAPETAPQDGDLHTIVSPMVGTFYAAPSPDAPPFVKVGDQVSEKTVVCIVEAMKLMNEIEAEVGGKIAEVLVENGQLVEFGQPLFLVKR